MRFEEASVPGAGNPKKPRRRKLFLRLGLAFLFLTFLIIVDYFAYPYGAFKTGRSGNCGENGIWLRYPWYFGQHSETEIQGLATNLSKRQFGYAYFHVRSVQRDGSLK